MGDCPQLRAIHHYKKYSRQPFRLYNGSNHWGAIRRHRASVHWQQHLLGFELRGHSISVALRIYLCEWSNMGAGISTGLRLHPSK